MHNLCRVTSAPVQYHDVLANTSEPPVPPTSDRPKGDLHLDQGRRDDDHLTEDLDGVPASWCDIWAAR